MIQQSIRDVPRGAHVKANDVVAGVFAFIGCALFAFDDIGPLRILGGGLMASPSWVFILAATSLVCRGAFRNLRRSIRIGWFSHLYGAAISLISLPFLPGTLLGVNVLDKTIRLFITIAVWMAVLFSGAILMARLRRWVLFGIATALAIMLGSAAMAYYGLDLIEYMGVIHSGPHPQMRTRGTRFEPSSLGAGIVTCLAIFFATAQGRRALLYFAALALLAQQITESRGAFLVTAAVVAISALAAFLDAGPRMPRNGALRLISAAAAGGVVASAFMLDRIVTSQAWRAAGLNVEGTSDATRSIWSDAAGSAMVHYPWGMAYSGYLAWLPEVLSEATARAADRFPSSQLSEALLVIARDSEATLSPKTLPTIAAVHLGLIGLVLVTLLYYRVISSGIRSALWRSRYCSLVSGAAIILSGATFYSSVFSWDQAFALGALAFAHAVPPRENARSEPPSLPRPHWIAIRGNANENSVQR